MFTFWSQNNLSAIQNVPWEYRVEKTNNARKREFIVHLVLLLVPSPMDDFCRRPFADIVEEEDEDEEDAAVVLVVVACWPFPTWTTLDNNLSITLLSISPHSTCHCSPSSNDSKSDQLLNTGRLFSGMDRPEAVVMDKTLRVRNVAMTWIFSAKLAPVSFGATSIQTLCSLLMDCTVICRFLADEY